MEIAGSRNRAMRTGRRRRGKGLEVLVERMGISSGNLGSRIGKGRMGREESGRVGRF